MKESFIAVQSSMNLGSTKTGEAGGWKQGNRRRRGAMRKEQGKGQDRESVDTGNLQVFRLVAQAQGITIWVFQTYICNNIFGFTEKSI